MRGVLRLALLALVLAATACRAASTPDRQLVLLAVEGLGHGTLSRLIAEGELPHLAELARGSGLVRVTSTPGAESASAWASFATGVNPGRHGVFDAVAFDPSTGAPRAATLLPRSPAGWLGPLWREGAAYTPVRDGPAFWTRLGEAGVSSRVLFVPGTFPPEPIPGGSIISGTPLPDWGGGWGSGYTWLASDLPAGDAGFSRHGGRQIRLAFNRRTAHATLVGLRVPETIEIPFAVTWSPEERSANVTVGDAGVHLNEGQQSRWMTVSARINAVTRVQGLVRVHLIKAGNDVQIYVSPVQWHPAAPPSAIAAPPRLATTLLARLGPFRTLSWPESGWALADGRLTEEAFLAAQEETFDDRAAALLSEAESSGWSLLIAGIETVDAMSRLPRRGDVAPGGRDPTGGMTAAAATLRAYRRLDALVGELRSRLPAHADIAVLSPHGAAAVRRLVDLNRWLTEGGWLAWRQSPPVTLASLTDPALRPDPVDWPRTAARAVGAGHISVNLRGRDPHGTIEPGAGYEALVAELRQALARLTDPASGERVVARVRTSREAYAGSRVADAPDLIVTFAPGYGGTFDSMLGGTAASVFAPNEERWRAGPAASDESAVPGVWISSVPLGSAAISIVDVAPTVLQYFGSGAEAALDGRPQLRTMPSSTSRRK
jgi:predicted AlkP superfamily phosphohydrolase/phosphomutase